MITPLFVLPRVHVNLCTSTLKVSGLSRMHADLCQERASGSKQTKWDFFFQNLNFPNCLSWVFFFSPAFKHFFFFCLIETEYFPHLLSALNFSCQRVMGPLHFYLSAIHMHVCWEYSMYLLAIQISVLCVLLFRNHPATCEG